MEQLLRLCGNYEAGKGVDVAGTCAMFCVSTKGIIPELHLDNGMPRGLMDLS